MLIWSEAHPLLRGMVLTAMFVTLCMSLCMMPTAFRRKRYLKASLLCLSSMVCFSGVVLFGAGMKAIYYGTVQGPLSRCFDGLTIWIPIAVLLAAGGFFAVVLVGEIRHRKNEITPGSIKESLDHLHTGLCFCDKNGMVILANHQMYALCQKILGRDLQNAVLFWEILSKGTVPPDVQRLSEGERPSFRLPDGSAWSFSRTVSDGVIQLIAADITQLQALADDLAEANLDLAERNLRLREYSKDAAHLARLQEQLDTKARIHSQFGQALMATRHFLVSEDETAEKVMGLWDSTIHSLNMASEPQPQAASEQTLQEAAMAAGLRLDFRGTIPPRPKTGVLFMYAAMEALTNAVRHADAQCLQFEISETDDMDIARFANDGKVPQGPITEGGGLGSLRRKTEQAGGTMTIETAPAFALVLTIPKERRDEL